MTPCSPDQPGLLTATGQVRVRELRAWRGMADAAGQAIAATLEVLANVDATELAVGEATALGRFVPGWSTVRHAGLPGHVAICWSSASSLSTSRMKASAW